VCTTGDDRCRQRPQARSAHGSLEVRSKRRTPWRDATKPRPRYLYAELGTTLGVGDRRVCLFAEALVYRRRSIALDQPQPSCHLTAVLEGPRPLRLPQWRGLLKHQFQVLAAGCPGFKSAAGWVDGETGGGAGAVGAEVECHGIRCWQSFCRAGGAGIDDELESPTGATIGGPAVVP
jgi:hypothetical protein